MFREVQREQEERDRKRGASDSPNVRAAEAKALASDAFDSSKPRASGRVENDYTLEAFAIPLERGIVLLKGARGFLAKFLKFGGEEVGETATKGASSLIAKGLGSTGRITAANLTEQLAMKEIVANPNLGKTVMTGMKDGRWLGWNKMQYTHTALDGTKTTIHYAGHFENGISKAVDDFKFK
ncbi:hypothetical protein [Dyadobacter bucti]|uniref:hypothetical protein n=1 Tax=Dyadobacter bucti TaxID=2572203 RepID=UPI003F725E1B